MPIPGDFFDAEPEPAQTTPAAAPKQTSAPAPSAIPADFFDAAPVAPPAAKPTTPQPAGIPSDFFDAPAATQAPPAAGEDFSQLSRLGTTPSAAPLAPSVLQPAISDTSAQPAQAASAVPPTPLKPMGPSPLGPQIAAEETITPPIPKPPPAPKGPAYITLNRVDQQGNRVPIEQTPAYQAARAWVQSATPRRSRAILDLSAPRSSGISPLPYRPLTITPKHLENNFRSRWSIQHRSTGISATSW